jgi:stress-induced-phosphoprotein 1
MEFQRAIEDCDVCIKKEPKFSMGLSLLLSNQICFFLLLPVKAYIRKGAALFAMREYSRAQKSYEDALMLDPQSKEALEGLSNCMRSNDEDPEKARERALQDPEVQEVWIWKKRKRSEIPVFFKILRDPGMRLLLEQMSQDPVSLFIFSFSHAICIIEIIFPFRTPLVNISRIRTFSPS